MVEYKKRALLKVSYGKLKLTPKNEERYTIKKNWESL